MKIQIYDTGYVNDEFGVSETPLDTKANASTAKVMNGEFRVADAIDLKIDSISISSSSLGFTVPSKSAIKNKTYNIANEKISFDLNCYLKIDEYTNPSTDLANYANIFYLQLTKGHKDLLLINNSVAVGGDDRGLFPLYWLLDVFGKQDNGNPDGLKHINIDVKKISTSHSVDKNILPIKLNCELLPYIR